MKLALSYSKHLIRGISITNISINNVRLVQPEENGGPKHHTIQFLAIPN